MAERANPSKMPARQAEKSRGLRARRAVPMLRSDAGRSPKSAPAGARVSGKSLLREGVPPHR